MSLKMTNLGNLRGRLGEKFCDSGIGKIGLDSAMTSCSRLATSPELLPTLRPKMTIVGEFKKGKSGRKTRRPFYIIIIIYSALFYLEATFVGAPTEAELDLDCYRAIDRLKLLSEAFELI